MKKLMIADACPLMLEGLKKVLADHADIYIQSTCHCTKYLMLLLLEAQPDVLLLDPALDGDDGIQLCQQLREKHPATKILLFSPKNDPVTAKQFFRAHVKGYLLRTAQPEELKEAILMVAENQVYLHAQLRDAIALQSIGQGVQRQRNLKITKRELEVLRLIFEEYKTKDIAQQLFISIDTVETHRHSLMRKLGAKNVAGLIKYAIFNNILSLQVFN